MLQVDRQPLGTSFASIRALIVSRLPAQGKPLKLAAFDPAALLPANRAYYKFSGSLTTPPCSEGLTWTVFRSPIQASPEQIRAFGALFPMNARPPQSLGRRFLLES